MILAIGGGAALLWILGLAVVAFVVIPVVLIVARDIVRSLREIHAYSQDVHEHAGGLVGALDAVPQLERSGQLTRDVARGFEDVGTGLTRALDNGDAR